MLFVFSLLLLATAVLGKIPVRGSTSGHDKRIVGGEFIPVHHIPHQAVIRQQLDFHTAGQCGAILISPEWLLTAEHCLQQRDINKAPVEAFLGVSRLEQIDPYSPWWTESVVKRRVVRYFRGPRVQVGNRTEKSDIMLLKLDRKVESSRYIAPIELPEVGVRWTNQTAVVSGFGRLHSDDQQPSRTLQYMKVPILSKAHCLAMYRKKMPEHYEKLRLRNAPETILCAGNSEAGRNICHGDSGGPLAVCATPLQETTSGQLMCKDNRWQLAGVISAFLSATRKCGEANTPAIYANVPVFSEWIRRTMRNN